MQADADAGRVGARATPDRWAPFADALDDAVPIVHRYLLAGTGGDAELAEVLTADTLAVAGHAFARGDDGAVALGALHVVAGSLLVARVSPLDRVRPVAADRGEPPPGVDDLAAALRRLPLVHRVVLALRHHDHLPVAQVATAVGSGPDEVTTVVDDAAAALGLDPATIGERLARVYAALDAPPDEAFVAEVRADLRSGIDWPEPRAAPNPSETPERCAQVDAGGDVAPERCAQVDASGEVAPEQSAPVTIGYDVALPADAPSGPDAGETPGTGATAGSWPGPIPPVGARRTRVRRERTVRSWLPVAAAIAVVAGLAVVTTVDRGGGADGRSPPSIPDAEDPVVGAAPGEAAGAPAEILPIVGLAPPAGGDVDVPEPTSDAQVVARAQLGPGGPYMNGPYALAAGDEGLWATAVADDGTWRAVRTDPVSGDTLAEIRIPGRAPTAQSHHGIALSGGYVWTPALRDGLFRIDADSNTPSGVVAVEGGVMGAALDGGDGAVWAVGNDGVLRRFDARTTEVTAAAVIRESGLVPDGIDLAYGDGVVWVAVADATHRHLIAFDPVTLYQRHHYVLAPAGRIADAYDVAADGDRVVITEAPPGGVTVVDGQEDRIVSQLVLPTTGIAVEGDRAWLLAPAEGRATVVWTRTGQLLGSARMPAGVEEMVPTAEGGVWAAVPDRGELVRLRFGG